MTTKEKIEFYTCNLEDRARNMWKVIEVSDLQDIMETYHQEQVKKLNIDDVSKSFYCLDAGIKGEKHLFKKQCDTCKRVQQ